MTIDWILPSPNAKTCNVGVLLGCGNGTFANQTTYSTGDGSNPRSVAVGDFNNDTRLDIVVANSGTNNVGILLGYGNGTFANQATFSTGDGSRPYSVAVIDFNNDNRSDIAVANSGTVNIVILFGDGNGTFANSTSFSIGYDSQPYSVAVGDFDEDSSTDIAVANYGTNDVEILSKKC